MVQLPPTDAVPLVKPLPTIPPYGDNAIEISNLTFSYRSDSSGSSSSSNRPGNVVLKDLNLTLPSGSRCLLIGANGSGKSVRSGSYTLQHGFTIRLDAHCSQLTHAARSL
jgi:ABC-type multidrug transport system fused ATPase/permease subunit